VKFFREIRLMDEEEEALELRDKAMGQMERDSERRRMRKWPFRVRG
jgi:hypothetical protein